MEKTILASMRAGATVQTGGSRCALGFDAHLGKPVVEEELLSTIRRLLG